MAANERLFRGPGLALSVVPVSRDDDDEELAAQVREVLPALKARGDVDVVFEELPRWASANAKVEKLLKVVATGWLKEGVRPWFVAQGYRYIPIDTRSQVTEVFTFCRWIRRTCASSARTAAGASPAKWWCCPRATFARATGARRTRSCFRVWRPLRPPRTRRVEMAEKTVSMGTAIAIGIGCTLLGAGGAVAVMMYLDGSSSGTTAAKTFAPTSTAAK
ncbi:hypothetical protein ACN28S_23905 [Cystobacter fuscus]